MKEGEWDSRDREKNRLTSLHLIGSSCNRKKKRKKRKKEKRQTTDDRKQSETGKKKTQDSETQKNRERTPPQRLAVRGDQHSAKADKQVATDQCYLDINMICLQFMVPLPIPTKLHIDLQLKSIRF